MPAPVTEYVPAVVGVPEMKPVDAISVIPGGRPVAVYVTGSPFGSLPASCRVSGCPTVDDCVPGLTSAGGALLNPHISVDFGPSSGSGKIRGHGKAVLLSCNGAREGPRRRWADVEVLRVRARLGANVHDIANNLWLRVGVPGQVDRVSGGWPTHENCRKQCREDDGKSRGARAVVLRVHVRDIGGVVVSFQPGRRCPSFIGASSN